MRSRRHFVHERLAHLLDRAQIRGAQPAVPGEAGDRAAFVGPAHDGIGRVRVDDVAALLEKARIVDVGDLDLAPDVFSALAPLELDDDLIPVLVDDVLGHPVAGVLDVHLDDDRAVTVVVAQECLDTPIQLGCGLGPAVVDHGFLVDADDVFADHDRKAAQGGADREGIPVLGRDEGRSERPGHDRHAALGPDRLAERRLDVDVGEDAVIGAARQPAIEALCPVGVTLDAQGMVSDAFGEHVGRACRGVAEVAGIEKLAPEKGG